MSPVSVGKARPRVDRGCAFTAENITRGHPSADSAQVLK